MSKILIVPLEVREKNEEFQLIIEVVEYTRDRRKIKRRYNIRLPIREHELMEWMRRLHDATHVAMQQAMFLAVIDQNGGRLIVGPKYH